MIFSAPNSYFTRFLRVLSLTLPLFFLFSFTSCFTGIESTKKINLSREDRKLASPTPEERFMAQIEATPLKEWETGRPFLVSDNKALLIIVPQEGILPSPPDSVAGKILEFSGIESKVNAAGDLNVAILFTDGAYIYAYDTGKEFRDAMENLKSDQVPMLIDLSMVAQARSLLDGKTFWTRSPLWYDKDGNRTEGRKYEKVTVKDVSTGNLIFPLKVEISTMDGTTAYLFMNFGSADNESRSLSNIFSLSDPRKHYPGIDDETWEYITRGKVKEGMTKEECRLALGNPSDSNSGHDYSQTIDIWSYENGRVLWFEDGRLVRMRQ